MKELVVGLLGCHGCSQVQVHEQAKCLRILHLLCAIFCCLFQAILINLDDVFQASHVTQTVTEPTESLLSEVQHVMVSSTLSINQIQTVFQRAYNHMPWLSNVAAWLTLLFYVCLLRIMCAFFYLAESQQLCLVSYAGDKKGVWWKEVRLQRF